ncbi:MAG: hypothetical protein IJ880_08750 [Bacilli bacterium]|nr:hypothetical protein [Bacilli bacterium]
MVDYQEPNIKLIINKLIITENATMENKTTAQANQELIRISRNGNTITFSTYMELNSYEYNGTEGKWVCFDVDTGFSSVVKLKLNNNILTDEYEDSVIHESGVEKGHLAIWLDASTIIESPASFTVSAAGFNDASFTIQYIHNNT